MILKILLIPVVLVLWGFIWVGERAEEVYWWLYHVTDSDSWFL